MPAIIIINFLAIFLLFILLLISAVDDSGVIAVISAIGIVFTVANSCVLISLMKENYKLQNSHSRYISCVDEYNIDLAMCQSELLDAQSCLE